MIDYNKYFTNEQNCDFIDNDFLVGYYVLLPECFICQMPTQTPPSEISSKR
jgi:hypothetical protein